MYFKIFILSISLFLWGCQDKKETSYYELESGKITQPIDIAKSEKNSYVIMENGSIDINFTTKVDANYSIYLRYIANDEYSNSIFFRIDSNSSKFSIWDMKKSKKWRWDILKSRNKNRNTNFFLKKGEHILTIKTREKRVRLDAIYISSTSFATSNKTHTYFASPNGTKDECSKSNPCSLFIANQKLRAGDTLLLYGGIYDISTNNLTIKSSGKKDRLITIKPYNNEKVILDGKIFTKKDANSSNFVGIAIYSKDYIKIENLEVKNMSGEGISITGSYNIIDKCKIHNNFGTGIAIIARNSHKKRCSSCNKGFNIVRNSTIYNNSGAGIHNRQKDDGNNADGISIASGQGNIIEHNIVHDNSDDGIDTWWSNDTIVRYNEVYKNGKGKKGNGNGIKAGGDKRANSNFGKRAIIEHNIVHNNRNVGIHYNLGKKVTIKYNKSYNNKFGFKTADNTIVEHNIEYNNTNLTITRAKHKFNSWQK